MVDNLHRKRHSELVGRVLGIVRMQEEIQVYIPYIYYSTALFFQSNIALACLAPLKSTLHQPQESLARTQAPPDNAQGQAVARPYLLASYSEDDVLGVIDGDSFLA